MSEAERFAMLHNLSQALHFSSLIAKSQGDQNWQIMEEMADYVLRELSKLAATENATAANQLLAQAVRLIAEVERNYPSECWTVH